MIKIENILLFFHQLHHYYPYGNGKDLEGMYPGVYLTKTKSTNIETNHLINTLFTLKGKS